MSEISLEGLALSRWFWRRVVHEIKKNRRSELVENLVLSHRKEFAVGLSNATFD